MLSISRGASTVTRQLTAVCRSTQIIEVINHRPGSLRIGFSWARANLSLLAYQKGRERASSFLIRI